MCVPEEAASNALAHSGASRLVFRWIPALKGGLDGITIEIEADGQGFDLLITVRKGRGLETMKARATLQGTFDCLSAPGEGTKLTI